MKKSIYFSILFSCVSLSFYGQNGIKLDTLLGENGILKRFKPKDISEGQIVNFNLKISFSGTDKQGKNRNGMLYLNTNMGYVGIAHSNDFVFDANSKNFNLMVFSNSLQNFTFHTDKKGKKTMILMPFDPKNNKKEINIKKSDKSSITLSQFNLIAYPYYNGNGSTDGILYFTETNLTKASNFKNQLAYAGLGFYQVGNKTVLCMAMETGNAIFKIDKIEAVKVHFNSSEFEKQEMKGMNSAVLEMMEKLKKK
jgi:hypothetical protein